MNKKQATILIVSLIVLILGAFVAGYYFLNQTTPEEPLTPNTPSTPTTPTRPVNTRPPTNTPNTPSTPTTSTSTPVTATTTVDTTVPRLRKLSEGPVSGFVSYTEKITENRRLLDKTYIRFFEKNSSGISQATASSTTVAKLANVSIPNGKVEEAVWNLNGKSLFLRYQNEEEEIETLFGELVSKKASGTTTIESLPFEVKTSFLPKNILNVTPLQNTTEVYLSVADDTKISGYRARTDGTQRRLTWSYPINEWLFENPRSTELFITSKPSHSSFGYYYSLNYATGIMSKIFSNINGLTTLTSPNTGKTLLSGSQAGTFGASIYSKNNQTFERFALTTLSEKCVWKNDNNTLYCAIPRLIPNGSYPDDWYQGIVQFSDEIWEINLENGSTRTFLTPTIEAGQEFDIYKLKLTPNEKELLFQNKRDGGSLWILRLDEELLNLTF